MPPRYVELSTETSLRAVLAVASTEVDDEDILRAVAAALRERTARLAFEDIDGELHISLAWDNEIPPYQKEEAEGP